MFLVGLPRPIKDVLSWYYKDLLRWARELYKRVFRWVIGLYFCQGLYVGCMFCPVLLPGEVRKFVFPGIRFSESHLYGGVRAGLEYTFGTVPLAVWLGFEVFRAFCVVISVALVACDKISNYVLAGFTWRLCCGEFEVVEACEN